MTEYLFNRKDLILKSLVERTHDLDISSICQIKIGKQVITDTKWKVIAKRIAEAKEKGCAIIFMMGGHVIRSGMQKYLIDLINRGYISSIATNGSGMIHDFEFALMGATTENVAKYIKEGQFGLWKETGILNDIINEAYLQDSCIGMGEAVGRAIYNGTFPYKEISLFAAAYLMNIPVTVHVGIGYDITHEYPNCNGAATGSLSYNDFLKFVCAVQKLENGVVMNFGSAVMAPEVFLKALSMARNVAHQRGEVIKHFTTLVCDIYTLPDNYMNEPEKGGHGYYFRPWKTMLVRTVADGGESFYIKGKHADTIPVLWAAINEEEGGSE